MKRILFILALFVWVMACTNNDANEEPAPGGAGGNVTPDTVSRRDTASYERMPQQATDSTKK